MGSKAASSSRRSGRSSSKTPAASSSASKTPTKKKKTSGVSAAEKEHKMRSASSARSNRNKKRQPIDESDDEGTAGSSDGEVAAGPVSTSDSSDEEAVEEPAPRASAYRKKSTADKNTKKKKMKEVITASSSEEEDSEEEETGKSKNNKFFSDENADWLKPKAKAKGKAAKAKQQLMSSSDEDDSDASDDDGSGDNEFIARRSGRGGDSEDSSAADDDSDDEMLEVERQSRLIDREMELEEAEAEAEYRRTIQHSTEMFHLPTPEELEDDEDRVVPPTELRERIDAILEVLADFKSRREAGRSRSEYIDQLQSDMAELFGYLPELVEHFLSMFGPAETLEFLTASDSPRPLVIRTNTLKARRKDLAAALLKRGVTLDPLASWSKVGLKISESPVPVGATPEYLAGHYMLQSAASMCPVMALSPQPNERVLDMSAAPGGKTSYLAQLMRNTGSIVANDLKPDRQKATVANMHRLGVRNVITCAYDGRKLGKLWPNKFDKVLLDAPCSGLGVISRDPSVKVQRTMADVHRTVVLQKEILLSAIDALSYKKGGGYIVYSTCSVSVAENEEVVNYVLKKRDVKLVDTGLDFGKPGFTRYQQKRFHPSLALTRRFYPHVHNFDGFYVAKLKKLSDKRPGDDDDDDNDDDEVAAEEGAEVHGDDEDASNSESSDKDEDEEKSPKQRMKDEATASKKAKGKSKQKIDESGNDKVEAGPARKKAKRAVPPPMSKEQRKQKQKKKQATNAKVTKPRRHKLGM
mmetsp:Transcript_8801/g.24828  ORF Transcript_8801/g.24828 Transcript_8801/m.24828 type:complete len:753 (+) Transcript_8801:84-2342(+)